MLAGHGGAVEGDRVRVVPPNRDRQMPGDFPVIPCEGVFP